MSLVTISLIVVGVVAVLGVGLLGLVIIIAWSTSGKKPQVLGGPTPSAFEREFADAKAVVDVELWAKARAYDLAQKQKLYDAVVAHGTKV